MGKSRTVSLEIDDDETRDLVTEYALLGCDQGVYITDMKFKVHEIDGKFSFMAIHVKTSDCKHKSYFRKSECNMKNLSLSYDHLSPTEARFWKLYDNQSSVMKSISELTHLLN
ncbi:MAG TPA: hypothetical protein PLS50_06915 [Candidatus Dojkabacteria bacterium]|nr:hypothetical protein [Candidatus Dojkabacteria bacterium]